MNPESPIRVDVVYALPEQAWRVEVRLPPGARVADALREADMAARVPGAVVDPGRLAIHGRAVATDETLRDGDRVEILRPLRVDPMQARRERARRGDATRSGSQ